jgi:tetratricopeptide (TPR) repeat protein
VGALADSKGIQLMPEQRVEFYKKALESSQMGKYQIREFFGQTSENIIRANANNLSMQQVKLELDFVISELEKTNKESPLEYRSVFKLAKLYTLYSSIEPEKLELANFYGEECLRLSPTNQQGYWALAQIKIYQGDIDTALSLAEQAIELEPRWLQSHLIAVQISGISEKPEITEQLIQNAIEINPEWTSEFQKATTTSE